MSNGIGKNPLNDISQVYLDYISEKKKNDSYLETDMKKRQANNEKARKEMEKMGTKMKNPHFEQQGWDTINTLTNAYKAVHEGIRDVDPEKGTEERKKRLEKKRGMKLDDHPQYAKEAMDPVGKEDGDVNNDGKKDSTDSYLMKRRKAIGAAMKKRMKEERELAEINKQAHTPHEVPDKNLKGLVSKAVKRIDTDVDGDTDRNDKKKGELGEFIPGVGNKRLYSTTGTKTAKESYSWRRELSEIMTDEIDSKPVKEKKVNNKIKINPSLGEAVEEIGGTLIEEIEVDEMEVVILEAYDELIEEGYSEDDVEFGIETALSTIDEASDSYYDDAVKASKKKRSMKDRLKDAAKKAITGVARAAGKAMKAKAAVQAAPDKAKSKVKSLADRVKKVAKAGYESGRGPVEKKSTAYRGAGAGRKEKVTEMNQGPSTPVKKYDGKFMPNPGAGRIKNVRPKGSAALRLAHTEHEGDMVQEAGGPALPGEPGRPGTPKAPGGRPHLPGEKQTPKPKKAGMLRLAHYEPDGDLVDENVSTGKAKRAKRGGIAQKVGAGEIISNKERDAAYAKKKAANDASDKAAGDAAHKAATDKGLSPAEAMMHKRAAERKAARERARKMKEEVEQIDEKALSKAQQRFMGAVYAAKKGATPASPEIAKAAASMTTKQAKDFAGTKHKKLPEKV